MKIQLETREGDKTVIDLNQDQLAHLCVEACGGGYTEQQTANAMLMLTALRQQTSNFKTRHGVWSNIDETLS